MSLILSVYVRRYLDLRCSNRPEYILRVYRADPTPIEDDETHEHNHYLRPPVNEKNFLISPPGSPPVGWEQTREDPPNATPLAEDLVRALRSLKLAQDREHHSPGVEVLIEPEETGGIGIYVEDCDGGARVPEEDEEDWAYGEMAPSRAKMRMIPTALPPMAINA